VNKSDEVMDVISIGGASRSGSTLLTLLLGELDGLVAVGELRYIWSRGFRQNMLCGCGIPFLDCAFWSDVFTHAYGDLHKTPVDEISELQDSVAQIWHLPQLLAGPRLGRFHARVRACVEHLDRVCAAIRYVSEARVIVDSSKLPSYCYLLSQVPGANTTLVHLVRDSRAVAFSFLRKRRKPDIHWTEAYMPRFSPLRSARDWDVLNLGMEAIKRTSTPYRTLRYEDLVRDPSAGLATALGHAGNGVPDLGKQHEMAVSTHHTVSGNPLRFTHGTLRIRPDTEWRKSMAATDRRVVTALTWPLLARYRYWENGLRHVDEIQSSSRPNG
jgi:hypothetical protein